MEIFEPKYTQKFFYASSYKEKLEKYGVNFEDDNYINHPKVVEYRTEHWVSRNMVHISAIKLIEDVFIGQEHLEKLYGPYSFAITRDLTERELKQYVWQNAIVDKCNGTEIKKDIEQYFRRKSSINKEGKVSGKPGLIERMQLLGFDFDAFEDDSNKIRLLHLLYYFEHDNDVKLVSFLGNPTLENADYSFGGGVTRNGILLRKLKMPIYPVVDSNYVKDVAEGLILIMTHWQEQIKKIRLYVDGSSFTNQVPNLDRIADWLDGYLENIDFNKNGIYRDGVLETFFLKLSQHEYLGNEMDLIKIRSKRTQKNISFPKYRPSECVKMAFKPIPKDIVQLKKYITDNIDRLACFVYDKEDVTDEEKEVLLKKTAELGAYINMINAMTQSRKSEYIQEYMIVAALAEIINPVDEKIENKFYRYRSSEQKKYSAELKNKKKHIKDASLPDAFDKSQLAWIDRVNERFDVCLGRGEETELQARIENNIDRLIIKLLSTNNLEDMMFLHNHFKVITDIFFYSDTKISEEWNIFANNILSVYEDYEITGSDYEVFQFVGMCMNTSIFDGIANQIINQIAESMMLGKVIERQYPIELYDNYIGGKEQCCIVFATDPYEKTVTLIMFGFCYYEQEVAVLEENGINQFEEKRKIIF